MPRPLSLAVEIEEYRAELKRAIDVVVAGRELHAALVSGDTARIAAAMTRFAVVDSPAHLAMLRRYPVEFKRRVLELARVSGATQAARLSGVGVRRIYKWRAALAPSLIFGACGVRRRRGNPPGPPSAPRRARALVAELYAAASR